MQRHSEEFFLCVPCAGGYYSFYHEFYEPDTAKRVYLMNGAEGVCGDTILKAVGAEAEKRGLRREIIRSAFEPSEWEALALPEKGIYLLDDAYPRTVRARYPVAVETRVDTDALFDRPEVMRTDEFRAAVSGLETERRRCMNYLSAVKSVCSDSFHLLSPCVDREKLRRYATRFAAREFPPAQAARSRAKNRFLSAVTGAGVYTNYGSLRGIGRVVVIDDGVGCVANLLIGALRREAEERGLSCTLCRCSTRPDDKAEHLLLPEVGLAFFTANRCHPAPDARERTIHVARFLDREKMSACRFRLNFNKKAEKELIAEAVRAQSAAAVARDVVRSYYKAALSPDRLTLCIERLIRDIFQQ